MREKNSERPDTETTGRRTLLRQEKEKNTKTRNLQ